MTTLLVGLAAVVSHAQFTGPAPLAWRWAQPTTVAPGGAPAVADDVLYVAVGSRIYAIERESGNQLWRFPAADPLDGNFRSGLLLYNDTIIASADNKLFYAVDAKTGKSLWQYVSPTNLIGSPVLVGQTIAFALSDNSINAISATDGKPIWTNPQRIFDGLTGGLSVYGGNILLTTQNFEVWSMNIATQKINFKTQFALLGPDVRPAVLGDVFYVNTGDFLSAVSALNGRQRWQVNTREPLVRNPAVSGAGVVTMSRDGRMLAYDLNGRSLLKAPIALDAIPVADPVLLGDLAAVPLSNGSLQLVNLKTGKVIWNYIVRPIVPRPTGSANDPTIRNYVLASGAPIVLGKTLYLLAQDGSLLAFDSQIGVDLTPPTVRMAFPNPGDQVSGQPPLQFIFVVTDEASGINPETMRVSIDGVAMKHEFTRDGFLSVRIQTEGDNKPLTDGRKVIEVVATDWLGNVKTQQFSVTVDNTLPKSNPRPTNPPGGPGGPGGRGGGNGTNG